MPDETTRAQSALSGIEERAPVFLSALFNASSNGSLITDPRRPDNPIIFANPSFLNMTGYALGEIIGRNCRFLQGPNTDPEIKAQIRSAVVEGREFRGVLLNYRKDGTPFWNHLIVSPVRDTDGTLTHFCSIQQDITTQREAELEVRRRYDELTAINDLSFVGYSISETEILAGLEARLRDRWLAAQGAVFLIDADYAFLRLRAAWGMPGGFAHRFKTVNLSAFEVSKDDAHLGSFWTLRASDPPAPNDLMGETTQRMLVIPLMADRLVGVLALFDPPAVPFGDDVTWCQAIGRQIGSAFRNAQFFREITTGRRLSQTLSQRLVQAQETERRQLAHELHDEIGQLLTGVNIAVSRAAQTGDLAILTQAQEVSEELIQRVRGLSLNLHLPVLDDLGLAAAVRWNLRQFERMAGIEIRIEVDDAVTNERFLPDIEFTAYRIVQEALTNVARHAKVTEVVVRLWTNGGMLHVQVADRGVGFDAEKAKEGGTVGLMGMTERAAMLGGSVTYDTTLGGGTTVSAVLPCAPVHS